MNNKYTIWELEKIRNSKPVTFSESKPMNEEKQRQNYICLNCKDIFSYKPDSCPECEHKTFHETYTSIPPLPVER